jgi:hypothetical protein
MRKKINKKSLISECVDGIIEDVCFNHAMNHKEFKLFERETKKIVSDFVKSYYYDTDVFGNECIADYSCFQNDLMSEIQENTTFFKNLN